MIGFPPCLFSAPIDQTKGGALSSPAIYCRLFASAGGCLKIRYLPPVQMKYPERIYCISPKYTALMWPGGKPSIAAVRFGKYLPTVHIYSSVYSRRYTHVTLNPYRAASRKTRRLPIIWIKLMCDIPK